MGALASVSNWKPEDDLLLRKAVEAGASLESLAKGAVEFSQKFTFNELKERWHSLLYNPVVSAEASAHMFELEYSTSGLPSKFNFNGIGNPKETTFPTKRNAERVRSRYYAMPKRMRVEPLDATKDLNFVVGPDNANYMGDAEEPPFGNGMLDDDALNNFQFEEPDLEIINNSLPYLLEDIPRATYVYGFQMGCDSEVASNVPENFAFTGNGSGLDQQMVNRPSWFSEVADQMQNVSSDFEGDQVFSSPIPECGPPPAFEDLDYLSQTPSTAKQMNEEYPPSAFLLDIVTKERDLGAKGHNNDSIRYTSETVLLSEVPEEPILDTDCYFAELSHSVFNEEDPSTDGDCKGMRDNSYCDLFLNSSNDEGSGNQENLTAVPEQAGTSVAPDCHKDVSGDVLGMGMNNNEGSYINVSSGPALEPHPEIRNGLIICLLNRESDEIPDNDHVAIDLGSPLLIFPSVLQNPKAQNSIPASARELLADKKPGKPPSHTQRIISQAKHIKTGQPISVGECCTKPKLPSSNGLGKCDLTVPRPACEDINITSSVLKDGGIGMQKPTVASDSCLNYPRNKVWGDKIEEGTFGDPQMQSADEDINPSTFEPEEDHVEDVDDVPHYSDIEDMILDMDLDPEGQDLFELEVSRYQHEDVKRAIMRLEQSAHACMQRDIAAHGAFAVLYGRYSKHYIKKPNVVLGRATREYPVDIDLGGAGSKTQISRRQAIISLKNDGSFHIKNVGKSAISVNETEIERGKALNLETNCLIEIRGMAFIFETNEACVERYLEQHQ